MLTKKNYQVKQTVDDEVIFSDGFGRRQSVRDGQFQLQNSSNGDTVIGRTHHVRVKFFQERAVTPEPVRHVVQRSEVKLTDRALNLMPMQIQFSKVK